MMAAVADDWLRLEWVKNLDLEIENKIWSHSCLPLHEWASGGFEDK